MDCRYNIDNECKLKNTPCNPAIGKCILKGKVERMKDTDKKDKE
jgi:hypothetical protein